MLSIAMYLAINYKNQKFTLAEYPALGAVVSGIGESKELAVTVIFG